MSTNTSQFKLMYQHESGSVVHSIKARATLEAKIEVRLVYMARGARCSPARLLHTKASFAGDVHTCLCLFHERFAHGLPAPHLPAPHHSKSRRSWWSLTSFNHGTPTSGHPWFSGGSGGGLDADLGVLASELTPRRRVCA